MKISRTTLMKAVEKKIIDEQQAEALLTFIQKQPEQSPNFNLANVLYYFGGLIAIGAMTLFMTLGWETFGGWWIFCLSLLYALLGLYLSSLFQKKNHPIPAGICATFVVVLTPLAIYGLQRGMGWWPDETVYRDYHNLIKWHWIFMELGTLLVGVILAYIYRYPFMVMPIAVTLWYISMDLTAMISNNPTVTLSALISMYFGLATILIAFWVDLRSRYSLDYAFWLYIFGVITFWGGISLQSSDSEISKFVYLCINLIMIGLGVVLVRKVFVVFGALGVCCYLGYLSAQLFKNSLTFTFALTLIGFGIIYLGTLWQKHEELITKKAQSLLPRALQELLQSRE